MHENIISKKALFLSSLRLITYPDTRARVWPTTRSNGLLSLCLLHLFQHAGKCVHELLVKIHVRRAFLPGGLEFLVDAAQGLHHVLEHPEFSNIRRLDAAHLIRHETDWKT